MCSGGGYNVKTADETYQEQKKDYGDLPSLSMTGKKKDRAGPQYGSRRVGSERRSLFGLMQGMNNASE